jgi:hypothetical protein
MAPKPPIDRPATARPSRDGIVEYVASTHGISSRMWKVSHIGGPPRPWLCQSEYQPPWPASGMTTMRS